MLGETKEDLGGTEYLKVVHYREQGSPPWLTLETEKALHDCLLHMIQQGWIQSAHDCSDGGLAVTIAECCFSPQVTEGKALGATIHLKTEGLRMDALLFGESPSRVVLSVLPDHADRILGLAKERDVPAADIGEVGGENLVMEVAGHSSTSGCQIHAAVTQLFDRWNTSLERKLHD